MPREGRPWWWPRCDSCGQWLSWQRMGEHDLDTAGWTCARCALRREITEVAQRYHLTEETTT